MRLVSVISVFWYQYRPVGTRLRKLQFDSIAIFLNPNNARPGQVFFSLDEWHFNVGQYDAIKYPSNIQCILATTYASANYTCPVYQYISDYNHFALGLAALMQALCL